MAESRIEFVGSNNCHFVLVRSAKTGKFVVYVSEPDDSPYWDYDDVADARELTADIAECKTFEEARNMLGV